MLPHSVRCLATGPRLLDIIKHECQTVLRGLVLRDFMAGMKNCKNFSLGAKNKEFLNCAIKLQEVCPRLGIL